MDTKFKRIQCLDRAIDILEAVASGKLRTVNEIGGQAGLNQSTAYNIVKTLEARGFIGIVDGIYKVGPRLGMMASNWNSTESLPLLTKPILEEVNKKTGESVCVTIMNGSEAEIINLMQGIRQVSVQFLHRNWSYPLNLATGRLLIALGPEQDWARHIKRQLSCELKNRGEKNWDAEKWESHLRNLREQDFAIIRIEPAVEADAIGAVAAPFRNARGALMGVIGSSCPKSRASDEHLLFMKTCIANAINSNPI